MKFSLLVCIVILCPIAAFAQQTAMTPDGKKVLLKSDGTWKYAEGKEGVTLRIEAGLVYQNGKALPAARTPFALLDSDPTPELMRLPRITEYKFNGLQQLAQTCKTDNPEAQAIVRKLSRYTFTAGFDGKAELGSIQPGKYWLFGLATSTERCVMWLMEIDLTKDQSLTLDQNNAR